MAIVSIKSSRSLSYDADGWISCARPVSTGITGRVNAAGVFAVLEKDKDHHSSLYDDAWMPKHAAHHLKASRCNGGPLPDTRLARLRADALWLRREAVSKRRDRMMRVIISLITPSRSSSPIPALFVPKARPSRLCRPRRGAPREAAEAARTPTRPRKPPRRRCARRLC